MGEGAKHPLSLGRAEPSARAVLPGTRSLPVLTRDRSLCVLSGERYLCVCSISARPDHEEISAPSDALMGRHTVSVRPEGGEICVCSHQGRSLCAGTGAQLPALPALTRAIHVP